MLASALMSVLLGSGVDDTGTPGAHNDLCAG